MGESPRSVPRTLFTCRPHRLTILTLHATEGGKGMTVFTEVFEGEDLAPRESTSEVLCAARHVRAWG